MSFWDLNDEEITGEYEVPVGGLDPIPDGTSALAIIEGASWTESKSGHKYIEIMWSVLAPEEFKNRKILQKLWVSDDDPHSNKPENKRKKARAMLGAIDFNAGKTLAKSSSAPTDDTLAALVNTPMVIKVMIWSLVGDQGDTIEGNWICAIAPKTAEVKAGVAKARPAPAQATSSAASVDMDSIPFAPEWRI